MKTRHVPLIPEFEFAGFKFPKYVWTLPPRNLTKRLERYSGSFLCGDYFHACIPVHRGSSVGFYLDSDSPISLRWKWCDEVEGVRIHHTGWWSDEFGDGDKIRGIVARLPKGRGFLAGWSMGEGMASMLESSAWESEQDAAHYADHMADGAAEAQRDYEREEAERLRIEEARAEEEELMDALCSDE